MIYNVGTAVKLMLKKLKINNFKSIIKSELTFGKVNLFIGANGSGKSNVLEAIGIISASLGRGISPQDLDYRGVRISLPRLFKSTFRNRAIPVMFSMEADFGEITYSTSIYAGDTSQTLKFRTEILTEGGVKIIGRGPNGIKIHKPISSDVPDVKLSNNRSLWDAFSQLTEAKQSTRETLDEMSKYAIYTPQTSLMRGMDTPKLDLEPLGLTGGRLAPAFSELFAWADSSRKRDALEDMLKIIWELGWSDQVKVGPVDPSIVPSNISTMPKLVYARDRFMQTKRNFLSAYDASEGSLYLLFVATLLAHPNSPKIFALDNVDGTLNPKLVRCLVEHLVDNICGGKNWLDETEVDRQVFLTSHNPTALDALDIFNPDHKVFVVERDLKQGGTTKITPLLPPKGMNKSDWIIAKKGQKMSHLFIDNMIRGALG